MRLKNVEEILTKTKTHGARTNSFIKREKEKKVSARVVSSKDERIRVKKKTHGRIFHVKFKKFKNLKPKYNLYIYVHKYKNKN